MRIKCSPGTSALSTIVNGERHRVEFKNGEAEVDELVGKYFVRHFPGVKKVQPPKEVESE